MQNVSAYVIIVKRMLETETREYHIVFYTAKQRVLLLLSKVQELRIVYEHMNPLALKIHTFRSPPKL